MRLRPLKPILAISVGFLGCLHLASAAPALVEVEVSNSTHHYVAARDSGSDAGGGYYNQCTEAPQLTSVNGVLELGGWCGSPLLASRVKLNGCYANIDGDLVPVNDGKGDFYKTCKTCYIPAEYYVGSKRPRPPSWMTCTCQRAGGNNEDKVTTIDLNLHVWVVDNFLGCPGVKGREMGLY